MERLTREPTEELRGGLLVIPATSFHRLTEREFGMPGLIAIESVGPFVEYVKVGPFITIHDSFLAPGLGIGHHPHRGNERLFYILQGEIRHDDSLNAIQGTMGDGDLARLTEGERGMVHREWNGREDLTTHAFILVYTPDVRPPVVDASFAALRAADIPRVEEAPGVLTLQLIGGASTFRASTSEITSFFDSTLAGRSTLELDLPPNEGLMLYPLEGMARLETTDGGEVLLAGSSASQPEGPDAVAFAWSGPRGRHLRLSAIDGARVIRLGFTGGPEEVLRRVPRPDT